MAKSKTTAMLGFRDVTHAWDIIKTESYLAIDNPGGFTIVIKLKYLGWVPIERIYQGCRPKSMDTIVLKYLTSNMPMHYGVMHMIPYGKKGLRWQKNIY
jgi:hypothetical protein